MQIGDGTMRKFDYSFLDKCIKTGVDVNETGLKPRVREHYALVGALRP